MYTTVTLHWVFLHNCKKYMYMTVTTKNISQEYGVQSKERKFLARKDLYSAINGRQLSDLTHSCPGEKHAKEMCELVHVQNFR